MHCHCCDAQLAPDEIKMTPEYGRGGFSPCGRCLEVIGELFNDDSDEEITQQLVGEGIFFELYQKDNENVSELVSEKT